MSTIKEKLLRAYKLRESLAQLTDAYRIVNGSADGFPGLTLDKFGDRYQIQFFGPELLSRKVEIVNAVVENFSPVCVVVKERLSRSGKSLENAPMEVTFGSRENATGIVHEGNAKFRVDLLDTVNPGLFLDMRSVRLEVEERFRHMSQGSGVVQADDGSLPTLQEPKDLRFLNLFSYTCSFSVHARLGGAAIATNADISGKILDKGRENYALNGLDLRPGEFFKGNAIEYVRWAQKKNLKFNGIVLDPPSFARFNGTNFNVRDHLMPLVAECASLLSEGGFFMVSSNYSEFNLKDFARDVQVAVASTHKNCRVAWARGQDVDFVGSGSTKDSCLVATLIEV